MNWVQIIDEPAPVVSLDGRVYSTNPRTTQATDGHYYYLKGPALEVVVSETLGYLLAEALGIPVPECALCRTPEGVVFASREVPMRSGLAHLLDSRKVDNPEILGECFAFDVWTANCDRNEGNYVARPIGHQRPTEVRLFAIDFESARLLRGVDRFSVTAIAPRDLQPRGELRDRCFNAPFPTPTCTAISRLTRETLEAIFSEVADALSPQTFAWRDSAAHALLWRGERINQLAEEVWNA